MEKETISVEPTIAGVIHFLHSINGTLNNNSERLLQGMERIAQIEHKLDLMMAAFPSAEHGGLMGHRMKHERDYIECQERKKVKTQVKGGIWLAGIMAVTLWMWQAGIEKVAAFFKGSP